MNSLQNILEKYCLEDKTGLLLLSMPTGFGKTHNVLDFIYHNYPQFKAQGRKIIFITNLKKNLPYQDLKKRFIQDNKEKEYQENVLFINSNLDFVIDNLLNCEIPEDFKKSENYKKLFNKIKHLENLEKDKKNIDLDYLQGLKNDIKDKYEPSFRYEIIETLKQKCKKKEKRLELIKNDSNYQWIGKLYPTVFTDNRTVLFLSIDKFFLKNSTLIEPSYYCYHNLAKNSLVFIDEFDTTKDTILNRIIEEGNKHKIDLISLFSNIHNNINNSEFPKYFLEESEKRQKQKISQNKNWKSLTVIIEELRQESQDIYQKFNLKYAYKLNINDSDKSRNFLFYDYENHNVLNRDYQLIINTDNEDNINWIKKVKHEEIGSQKNKTIPYLLGQVRGFITYFETRISFLAENYHNLKKEKGDDIYSLESAIRSILDFTCKEVDKKTTDWLMENILKISNSSASMSKNEKQINEFQSFYEVGFKYHDIVDNDNHDLSSKIYFYNFNQTPEGFLWKLCQQGMVVGISATASMDTNIGNYDIKFLKQYLKNSFYSLSEDEINQLKNEYEVITKGYNQIEIKAKFIGTEDKNEALEILKTIVKDEVCANSLLTESQGNKYVFCRYVRLLEAWQYFNQNEDCQAFICFLNKFPKDDDSKLDLKIINPYFCYANGFDPNEDNLQLIKKQYVILSSKNFDEELKKLKERLATGERIFIISTYQTLGAGVNLQYTIPEGFNAVKINDFDDRLEMDINGVYLENPTNLLITINSNEEEKNQDKNFIKHLFQLEFLLENGVMSRQQFKGKLDEAFHKYIGDKNYRSKSHIKLPETSAFTKYLNKVIIQALGRICRTNMKASTIHILADSSIKKYLNRVQLPSEIIPVKEYQELVKNCNQSMIFSEEIKEAKNKAETTSEQDFKYIQNRLNNIWDAKDIEKWKSLRKQVLCQPTIVNKLDCEKEWFKIYIELSKPNNYYRFTQTNDYGKVKIFFDKNEGNQEVSEMSAKLPELMKIDLLKDLFIENNWATNFEKAELIISPPIFNNIYKGALGEVCGKHILETYSDIKLLELDDIEFERFDFKTADGIYFDFKYWNNFDQDEETELEKIRAKMTEINAQKVFIINILANTDNCAFIPKYHQEKKIIIIPFLCQNNKIVPKAIDYLSNNLS
ncbi:MAG: hypothetical protein GW795_05210 [Cyanobacteria bacterium]|nr:hypothetical protein [Cyanobacteria bacterium CG_2015-16_32_12]NCO79226.1 hypothetical protein [Cyanobacteria bacterium CG_2015-22_32_23]NCQ04242.1 hypothetical protein [Cyanobacteria bacterium CG_2015-09_32_10]NCQ41285.1 hypothetical protein [Cyanobacteria bacterium CG_2015-04_32_10]NCS85324.1 hypothetical protein [Cyanobacteria bacterium CG_2015-02_32_10]